MYLSEKTRRHRNDRNSAGVWDDSSLVAATWLPGISGNPTDSGVSRNCQNNIAAVNSAIPAGTKKQIRQFPKSVELCCVSSSKYPHKISTPAAPKECEAFQNDIFVANSL